MIMDIAKVSQKMKKISWLSIEKSFIKGEEMTHYNYQKEFSFRKFLSFYFRAYVWKVFSQKTKSAVIRC